MYVLGISCFYHDAGAALVKDGILVAAAEEERFTRKKHDSEFPSRAIQYCLDAAGITIDQVDHIGFYEKPLVKFQRILETCLAMWPRSYWTWMKSMPLWLGSKLHVGRTIQEKLGTEKDIIFCEHHLSHAASAFLVSPYEEAVLLTMDGVGEWTTTAYGIGRGSMMEFEAEIRFPHSIGLLFSAITAYLGFKVNDAEWKVMGLAPYGQPKYLDKFREVVDMRPDGSFRLKLEYFAHHYSTKSMFNRRWENHFGRPRRKPETELDEFHYDIAHSGQKIVEELVVNLARALHKKYKIPNLCIAGGVGLNCVANWKIFEETGFKNIYIQPAAGDSGGAIGTAFHIANTLFGEKRVFHMNHAYWGPEYSNDQIRATLDAGGADYTEASDDELFTETARRIEAGQVIGWFQGRMEFGPRSLGARSILADPRNPKAKDIINSKVKFREWFRPFAPAVIKERAHEYFDMPAGMDLPFMLMVPKVRPQHHSLLPAITHKDGTGRVQTLTPELNGRFYHLVKRFGELTGVPIVVNTSFNVRGEPIVQSPEDAYRTFLNTGIDALVIGNFIVTQKKSTVDFEKGMKRSIALEGIA